MSTTQDAPTPSLPASEAISGPASVDPSEAQGAQIPLDSFTVPEFPPSARHLRALTLTSDIKVDKYQEILSQAFTIPTLPTGIESLTLELFSLGYPSPFLSTLSTRLPNLKSIVIYSQLFAGITPESQSDATTFFKNLPNLRALHLLDVFAKPNFFSSAAKYLRYIPTDSDATDQDEEIQPRRGLMFLEVNYTYRHEDPTYLTQIPSTELPSLIGPGLISCSFNISPPENAEDDEQDPITIQEMSGKEGIMALNKAISIELVERLVDEEARPVGLKALNLTLYTLTIEQVGQVLGVHSGIMVLSFTVELDPGEERKKELLKCLEGCGSLEQVEIVVNPSLQFIVEVQSTRTGNDVLQKTFPTVEDMESLEKHAPRLSSFKANVLRTSSFGSVEWIKKNGKWTGGVIKAKGIAEK